MGSWANFQQSTVRWDVVLVVLVVLYVLVVYERVIPNNDPRTMLVWKFVVAPVDRLPSIADESR